MTQVFGTLVSLKTGGFANKLQTFHIEHKTEDFGKKWNETMFFNFDSAKFIL